MIIKINPKILECEHKFQCFCRRPYPNHARGCPNHAKKQGCPPQPLINYVLNFKKPVYVVYTEFNIAQHAEKMKKLHPNWSERQIYCCLYWQPKARKAQRQEESKALKQYNLDIVIKSPEAYGVNVDSLMKKLKINLEWPPRKITRIVSLAGYSR